MRPTTALILSLGFSLLLLSSSSRAQDPKDDDLVRINTDLVVLNVTVTDELGKYVHGLQKSDFHVFEENREQGISSFSVEETPFAAAVLLDFSGSMERRVSMARSAAIRFLDGLREGDVASVYRFDTEIEQLQDFSTSRDLAPLAFSLRADGWTVLNDAVIRAASDLSRRSEKRRAIVVLSDGADTKSRATGERALAEALAADITLYTVDMSDPQSPSSVRDNQLSAGALRNFASKSGGRYIRTPGGQALRDTFASVVEELSNQYTLAYQTSNRSRDGQWRALEVRLSRPGLTVRTRKGYRSRAK